MGFLKFDYVNKQIFTQHIPGNFYSGDSYKK